LHKIKYITNKNKKPTIKLALRLPVDVCFKKVLLPWLGQEDLAEAAFVEIWQDLRKILRVLDCDGNHNSRETAFVGATRRETRDGNVLTLLSDKQSKLLRLGDAAQEDLDDISDFKRKTSPLFAPKDFGCTPKLLGEFLDGSMNPHRGDFYPSVLILKTIVTIEVNVRVAVKAVVPVERAAAVAAAIFNDVSFAARANSAADQLIDLAHVFSFLFSIWLRVSGFAQFL
jgi:hypothetical protein